MLNRKKKPPNQSKETPRNNRGKCRHRAYQVIKQIVGSGEIVIDVCLCKENYGPRWINVYGCCPVPDNYEEFLKARGNSKRCLDESLPPCCEYFEYGRAGGKNGGNTPVLV